MNLDMETGIALIKSISGANGVIAAKTAAQVAQAAAEAAQGKAETAQTAAETAQGLAEAAQTAAETAQGAAEDVLESIPQDYSEMSADVSNLKSHLNGINQYLEVDFSNLFFASTVTGSKRINISNGEAGSADAMFSVSDYIPVVAGKEYAVNFSYYSSGSYGMAYYKSDKSFLIGVKQANGTSSSGDIDFVFTPPTNAAYIRITLDSNLKSASETTITLNNGAISDRFNIGDLVGNNIKPLYATNYNYSSASVTTYSDCPLENGHRYTVIKKETTAKIVSTVGCIKSGSWAGTGVFDYRSPNVVSFTTTNSGSLATAVSGTPVSGSLSVFDTTGNDALKEYLEKQFGVPGSDVNLKMSNALKKCVDIETGAYSTDSVVFVGDSQTQRNTFTSAFKTLYSVRNNGNNVDYYGYGGAGAREIASFQGGITLFAKPFTIPADTTAVEIDLYTDAEDSHEYAKQSQKGLTNIYVDGILGSISYSDSKNYFTRSASGDSDEITRPIRIRSQLSYLTHSKLIIEVGTNDTTGATEESLSSLLKDVIHSMIRHNKTEQYIVLGLTAKVENLSVSEVNQELARTFGDHFIDTRTYLINYGLEDENITPTAQDEADIAAGDIPSSLRDDAIHFNQYGGNVIGKLVYDRGVDLGYWK